MVPEQIPLRLVFFLYVPCVHDTVRQNRRLFAMILESTQKSERIDVRTTPTVKRILQEAAATSNKTVTEFLIDSALTQAAEVLANRRVFSLTGPQWKAFMDALDAPPLPMPRLKKLLMEPSILENPGARNDQ